MNLKDKDINRRQEIVRELDDYAKERELLEGAEELLATAQDYKTGAKKKR